MSIAQKQRLLTVGHSFVLRSNRRLAEAIQDAANGTWEVTVAAPVFYRGNPRYGDLKPEHLVKDPDERVRVVGIPVAFTDRVHIALYGTSLRTLMASGFDAIHCWEEPFILSGSQMAYWAPRDSLLTYSTFQNIRKRYPPPFGWLEKQVLKRADGWIAGATLVEKALEAREEYRRIPHRLIGMGLDPKVFRPNHKARAAIRNEYGWDDATPVVGYLGRFTEPKGVAILMRVLNRIKTPWNALFVGSGPLEGELATWAKQHAGRIKIVTGVSHDQVSQYLNAMDLLVAPSQTTAKWREQFGRMLIEAFACRVAVVTSDSGEIPYVVGNAARVVSEANEFAYQENIEELMKNDTSRLELADRGYQRVMENFTWEAIGAKHVSFFEHLRKTKALPNSIGSNYHTN